MGLAQSLLDSRIPPLLKASSMYSFINSFSFFEKQNKAFRTGSSFFKIIQCLTPIARPNLSRENTFLYFHNNLNNCLFSARDNFGLISGSKELPGKSILCTLTVSPIS